ncbi:alpha/beta fold hydrolase [Aeromicrobium wangtongii]|uniref:Alpha/beta hydrolase n=1 Tax=Aeromicrobium wangtongii TaxID=2969247 RepID=A0ABY5M7G9_9ACTN|nr:alpha/beta fold hydrolase [Aeromicrobium wangtongii]MCD9198603.1 alpha/beta hydrolase [Aeromicrobium wangtongii]UUP12628.1 alpha/beta hydrolase [Aeromicrobium wangtongii]
MTSFVLVHGAFRGGWAWSRVRPLLAAAGHDVHAPSLIGAGEHVGRIAEVTGLDVWVDQVTALIELEDLSDVVLVGHSQGGLVTTAVAARVPDRIAALVHLDAAVPAPGERAVDMLPGAGTPPPRDATVPSRPASTESGEYDAATVAWLNARLTVSPVAPALDPVPAVPSTVRETFVFCARTPDGYPSGATRARVEALGVEPILIAAGHDAPLSAPAEVARILLAHSPTSPTKDSSP